MISALTGLGEWNVVAEWGFLNNFYVCVFCLFFVCVCVFAVGYDFSYSAMYCFTDRLSTDYQYTFNLSKNEDINYTQINFLSIPGSVSDLLR